MEASALCESESEGTGVGPKIEGTGVGPKIEGSLTWRNPAAREEAVEEVGGESGAVAFVVSGGSAEVDAGWRTRSGFVAGHGSGQRGGSGGST